MAVVAPIPRANVRIAVMANAGDLVSLRNAYRKSMPILSSVSAGVHSDFLSFVAAGFPKRSQTSRRAPYDDIPDATLSSVSISIWDFSSASISRSTLDRESRFKTRWTSDIGSHQGPGERG